MTMRIATTSPFAGLEEVVQENIPLAPYTWYKIGGPARYLVRPRSIEELQLASQGYAEENIPVFVLGLGADLLVSDAGVDGAVFRLNQDYWRDVKIETTAPDGGGGFAMRRLAVLACPRGDGRS